MKTDEMKLNKAQRAEAISLEDCVMDTPEEAAHALVWHKVELAALEQHIAELERQVQTFNNDMKGPIRTIIAFCGYLRNTDDCVIDQHAMDYVITISRAAEKIQAALSPDHVVDANKKVLVSLEQLREIEWSGVVNTCPVCTGSMPEGTDSDRGEGVGHTDDCWLDAKIEEAENGS